MIPSHNFKYNVKHILQYFLHIEWNISQVNRSETILARLSNIFRIYKYNIGTSDVNIYNLFIILGYSHTLLEATWLLAHEFGETSLLFTLN